MAYNVLYPLGNSDLQFYDGEVPRRLESHCSFREITEHLWKILRSAKFESDKWFKEILLDEPVIVVGKEYKRWALPMFGKAWADVIGRNGTQKCNKIFLFATDQQPPHRQDTIYLAYLLKEMLISKYMVDEDAVEILPIRGNPSDTDEMGKFFEGFVGLHEKELRYAENYLFVGPGTPAISINLSVSLADFSTEYRYLRRGDRNSTEIIPLEFFKKLSRRRYETVLTRLIDSYEYAIARKVVAESPFSSDPVLERLLYVITERKNYNFECAYEEAQKLPEDFEKKREVSGYLSDIVTEKRNRLCAIYEDMCIYVSREDYHAALAMLFSFTDVLNNELVHLLYPSLDLSGRNAEKNYSEFLDSNPELKRYLETGGVNCRRVSRICLEKMVKKALSEADRQKFSRYQNKLVDLWRKVFEEMNKDINDLRDLRNKGPFAHGWEGVGEEIANKLEMVVKGLDNTIKGLCGKQSFYELVNRSIKGRLSS